MNFTEQMVEDSQNNFSDNENKSTNSANNSESASCKYCDKTITRPKGDASPEVRIKTHENNCASRYKNRSHKSLAECKQDWFSENGCEKLVQRDIELTLEEWNTPFRREQSFGEYRLDFVIRGDTFIEVKAPKSDAYDVKVKPQTLDQIIEYQQSIEQVSQNCVFIKPLLCRRDSGFDEGTAERTRYLCNQLNITPAIDFTDIDTWKQLFDRLNI